MDRRSPHPDITKRGLVTIVLSCGDQVTARNQPLNIRSTYMCVANKGHGYSLMWVKYRSFGSTVEHDNPLAEAQQTD